MSNSVNIAGIPVGGTHPLLVIAGPCVIATEEETVAIAQELKAIAERVSLPLLFKASYDKANRSSVDSYRGPGLEKGLEILARVRSRVGVTQLEHLRCLESLRTSQRQPVQADRAAQQRHGCVVQFGADAQDYTTASFHALLDNVVQVQHYQEANDEHQYDKSDQYERDLPLHSLRLPIDK